MEGDLLRALLSGLEPTEHVRLRDVFHQEPDGVLRDAASTVARLRERPSRRRRLAATNPRFLVGDELDIAHE